MIPGDIVRIRKTAITYHSSNWFIWLAEKKSPLVLIEKLNKQHWKVLRPDGTDCFIQERDLTTRLW
jgi:hypothetical protein|tara:strand:- start:372 stop:569 length:198 start_codon:yes stop_codon:yes gene_type:complete